MKSVAIQGIRGSFHEQAAKEYFSDEISVSESKSFDELVAKTANNTVDYGIIAIENTVAGTIHQNLLLIRNSGLNIIGEIKLRIGQNLAVKPGTKMSEITEVQSHYMALNQSKKFLNQYPHIKRIAVSDTATALKKVAEANINSIAAIGSQHGAYEYGLEIIAEGIETFKQNYTRFLVITNSPYVKPTFNKSTVILKLPHEKGELALLLSELDKHPINLSKIESFPIMGEPWSYEFIIDLEYNDAETHEIALSVLKKHAKSYSVLGLYDSDPH